MTTLRWCLVLLGLVTLSACSLAGDVTPPPGQTGPLAPAITEAAPTSAPSTPADLSRSLPPMRPSAAEGAVLFAEHCADCHGATGQGDGPMAAQLSGPLPDFSSPDLARASAPRARFQAITLGNLERLMPPFGESLTEIERWDLEAYVRTLSTSQAAVDSGRAVYTAQCAECHGDAGQGVGTEIGSLTDSENIWAISPTELFTQVLTLNSAAHKLDAPLSDADQWAALDYARTLAYDYLAPGTSPAPKLGTVVGQIANGTAGAAIPSDLEATLFSFDAAGQMTSLTTTVEASGAFRFDAVPHTPGQRFMVATDYQSMPYHSAPVTFGRGADELDVTLNVYELTADPAQLSVKQMHVFVEFTTPASVTIGQLFNFSNNGDRTYMAPDGRTLAFTLPPNATDLTVQEGEVNATYFLTDDGFVDTRPVLPGTDTAQVLFWYTLPYAGDLVFEQPMGYAVGSVNVLVSDLDVALTGANFQDHGPQSIQGVQFQSFIRTALQPGETLSFTMNGQPNVATTSAASVSATANTLTVMVGAVALAVVLGGGGWWWYRRAQARSKSLGSREDYLQALAELDDEYAAGRLEAREYERERRQLKGELLKMMQV